MDATVKTRSVQQKTAQKLVLALVTALLLIQTVWHPVGVYNGLNKGLYFGNCGIEVVGTVGLFCDVYPDGGFK